MTSDSNDRESWKTRLTRESWNRRIQQGYAEPRRPSHVYCRDRQRLTRSYYTPDSTGWRPDRPSPRGWKEDESRLSRKERLVRKRALGHHKRMTWLAQNYWSLAWTTCGHHVLGPPLGTWEQYPRSKRMRQRDARHAKKAKKEKKS
jgi:hypothetical protein